MSIRSITSIGSIGSIESFRSLSSFVSLRLVERATFIDAVKAGAAAARRGDLHPDSEASAILDSFGEADD